MRTLEEILNDLAEYCHFTSSDTSKIQVILPKKTFDRYMLAFEAKQKIIYGNKPSGDLLGQPITFFTNSGKVEIHDDSEFYVKRNYKPC